MIDSLEKFGIKQELNKKLLPDAKAVRYIGTDKIIPTNVYII